ncbi:uncharacterized protein N7483_002419 [Penicillium malachiteum]|uniref:uncharacterized protein n=1 Tax=Penicillium malachiteum TaxID=1324776 RepID=UPI002546B8E9|nr:uncharacterized protein N7483_002419 [Penicillium malachiteum]KAJ5737294.1 hypothetical protein N7483_002419 [Penicillium malachiteum]
MFGHSSTVSLLLQHDSISVNEPGPHKFTALLFASANGMRESAENLLRHPDTDSTTIDDKGRTSLWWAQHGGHSEIVRLLSR